jgi:hypothetical protein
MRDFSLRGTRDERTASPDRFGGHPPQRVGEDEGRKDGTARSLRRSPPLKEWGKTRDERKKEMKTIPKVKAKVIQTNDYVQFGGLNITSVYSEGELCEVKNMSGIKFPRLQTRRGYKAVKEYIDYRDQFDDFVYAHYLASKFDKVIVLLGLKMYIDDEFKYIFGTPSQWGQLGNVYGPIIEYQNKLLIFNSSTPIIYDLLTDSKDERDVNVFVYPMQVTFGKEGTSYISITTSVEQIPPIATGNRPDIDFTKWFKIGDTLQITGCVANPQNDGYYTIIEMTPDPVTGVVEPAITPQEIKINVSLPFGTEPEAFYANIVISRSVPKLKLISVWQNRLCGVGSDENDKTVYISKFGDPTNFNYFLGGADDSWFIDIVSSGDITGLIEYQGDLLVWKTDSLIRITGTDATNYTVSEYAMEGVKLGCEDSLTVLNGVLYYAGRFGIMSFNGGYPENISVNKLDYWDWQNVKATNNGKELFFETEQDKPMYLYDGHNYDAMTEYGQHKSAITFVYNLRYDVWHKYNEGYFPSIGLCYAHNKVYTLREMFEFIIDEGNVDWVYDINNPTNDATEKPIEWGFTFTPFASFEFGQSMYSSMELELEFEGEGYCSVSTAYGDKYAYGGEGELFYDKVGIISVDEGLKSYKEKCNIYIPIKATIAEEMYVKCEGSGLVTVKGLRLKKLQI